MLCVRLCRTMKCISVSSFSHSMFSETLRIFDLVKVTLVYYNIQIIKSKQ